MRRLTVAIIIGPLMLFGALPAAMGQSAPTDKPTQSTAGSDRTTDRDTYTQKAQDTVQEWQQKLHDFNETAKAKGQTAGKAATDGLNTAWTNTQDAAHKLKSASAATWDSAKTGFEKASHDLSDAWDKIRSQGN